MRSWLMMQVSDLTQGYFIRINGNKAMQVIGKKGIKMIGNFTEPDFLTEASERPPDF